MSNTVTTNIADYLTRIESLTSTNLQILKTINDSFFTKKNHLFAEVDNTTYVIPSFISLENKINMLQENFENLVKSPENSEAYFNFDGNTRAIEVRKYSHVPDSLTLPTVSTYSVEANDVFKDFLTPLPYINFDLPTLPNDIVEVNVKKIIAKNDNLKALFRNKLSYTVNHYDNEGNLTDIETLYNQSINEPYGNVYKMLLNYKNDIDYIEYDTIYKLPMRKNIGTGTYIIESVISDIIDDDLNEIVTLKIKDDNKLTYKAFDDTIERPLKIGDHLTNFDGTGKVVIKEIRFATNTIVVQVVNGEYLNFLGTTEYDTNNGKDIHDFSKLKFYADIDFDLDKYIKVPLEEDQYIYIAIAAVNSRMNVQSSWGNGIILNTYSLKNNDTDFNTYYKNNVKNLGDVLLEVSNMITSPITELSQNVFNRLTSLKPEITKNDLSVMMINKHLNNSNTVKNIRNAYNQKKTAENELVKIQNNIKEINEILAKVSFNDTTGIYNTYTSQLNTLKQQESDTIARINNAINTISLSVNSAEIPIENAKYRIRGFYNLKDETIIDNINVKEHVIGLQVQYRYKNISTELGNAVSINASNGQTQIYSDWNVYNTKNKLKIASFYNGVYKYEYEQDNETKNEPSYNQIDIPITQGETVDIRVRVVYDFGQPYITMMSEWSDIINIPFPTEFTTDVPVLTIIEENNKDIESNRFNDILKTGGITDHINDKLIDNNINYYHKPEHIASGYYTEERRVIPLKDKLESIVNDIALLKSDVLGINGSCKVSIRIGNSDLELKSMTSAINIHPYNLFNEDEFITDTSYEWIYETINGVKTKTDKIGVILNLVLSNPTNSVIKLYPLFYGPSAVPLYNSTSKIVDKDSYIIATTDKTEDGTEATSYNSIYYAYKNGINYESNKQLCNQFITFRTKNVYTGEDFYSKTATSDQDGMQLIDAIPEFEENAVHGMIVYPMLDSKYDINTYSENGEETDVSKLVKIINPGEEIIIPIMCQFILKRVDKDSIYKYISFDLRTSLYKDPITYTVKLVAKKDASSSDIIELQNKKSTSTLINTIKNLFNRKYKTTV